ncbi:MAG: hypothetical protein LAP13_12470 [Acidobacteriia bacterium]|nr:hypothetical protein [Terriglobia bacterium]
MLHDPDFNACNTFKNPDRVVPTSHPVRVEGSTIYFNLPVISVVTVILQLA